MREILFRGKRTDNGEWVEGYYIKGSTRHCIVMSLANYPRYDVIPETLGQYTGLTDKNGKRIFEGDIIKNIVGCVYSGSYTCTVVWRNGWFCAEGICVDMPPEEFGYCEVIGNIHDNPKLLKESEGGE